MFRKIKVSFLNTRKGISQKYRKNCGNKNSSWNPPIKEIIIYWCPA